jgi:hypothetical protein
MPPLSVAPVSDLPEKITDAVVSRGSPVARTVNGTSNVPVRGVTAMLAGRRLPQPVVAVAQTAISEKTHNRCKAVRIS